MNIYTVEVHAYPQQFIVAAENEADAKAEAHKRWYAHSDMGGVYETKVTFEEKVEDNAKNI